MPVQNVFAVQLDIAWEDKQANRARIESLLESTPPTPGSIVVLPEMSLTGFSLELQKTRQGGEREDDQFIATLARKHQAVVVGGVVSDGGTMGHNEAVAYSPAGELLACYTKIHTFSLGGEAQAHASGKEIATFPWGKFLVAPFVCYDLRFPEIFRAAAKRGANLFVVIALWPVKRQQHWLTLLQARAIENQAYVIGVNRVGSEPKYQYAGRSIIVDPHGVIVADAGEREQVLAGTVDSSVAQSWRQDFPALRDSHWVDDRSYG